ncbi:LuxR C-terminal-related transcriptional regulator [Nocardia sp. NPDC052254]|uniref:LuxR C-terminal-related transcriptional regulator n=1 Tax=Nocardia sp. NPDC052254 TaxID=3155681 RepID=UPI00343563D5
MNADEWAEIKQCDRDGETIKGIAQRLGMSRNTVRRALSLPSAPDDHRRRTGRVTDAVDAQVRDIIVAHPETSIAEIGRRIRWTRSRTMLARKVTEIRRELDAAKAESYRVATGVPTPATSFVGRRSELRELRGLLGEHRLVSIVGPGGIGKTRLSIQAAYEFRRAFPDGVRFVELAAVRTPGLIAQVVCDGLALDSHDIHHQSPEDTLVEYLRTRRMLLVLDNCEHLVDAAAGLIARLLTTTSELRVVTTTREYLSIPGEYVFNLPPLPTRDGGDAGATALFASRAAAVLSGFELDADNTDAVENICRRLDGLPLAIELACARLSVLSIDDLSELLDHRLSVLTTGARTPVSRHRSLHATIDWSYDLCTTQERELWSRLSVFTDGFDLPMAVRVCADDTLPAESIMDTTAALVAKSVVHRENHGRGVRFHMLESIREYGDDRLPAMRRDQLRKRLLTWCVDTIRAAASGWYDGNQDRHIAMIETNRGNIRAALENVMSPPIDASSIGEASDALSSALFLWACGISVGEHRMWLTRILDIPGVRAEKKGWLLAVLALVEVLQGDRESARFCLHRARTVAAGTGDGSLTALVTHITGLSKLFAGELDRARANMWQAEAGYATHGSPPDLIAMLRVHQGMLLSATGETAHARAAFQEVYDHTGAVGERWFHSYAIYGLGLVALREGDFDGARDLAIRGLTIQRSFGDVLGTTLMTDLLSWTLAALESPTEAAVLLGATSTMWGSIGQQLYGSAGWIALREEAIGTARREAGPSAFERCWERGRAMSMTDLVDFALADSARPAGAGTAVRQRHAVLTARETEVADLVAIGMTNKQIAAKLVLSPRTVEGHVEHVLNKLGLSRRGELAAARLDEAK